MANRFFVGVSGAKNWNDTANWSDTTGGAGGFSVPTSVDTVTFDASSLTGSCTLTIDASATCGNLDFSGLDASLNIVSSVYGFSMYGNLTEHATFLSYTFTGTAYVYSKGSGTYTTNGNINRAWNRWYIDGVGITVIHGDNFIGSSLNVYMTNGTWNTNNKTITVNRLVRNGGTHTLTWGSSVITIVDMGDGGGATTLTANTSTLTIVGAGFQTWSLLTWNNVILNSTISPYGIAGSGTISNLTINGGITANAIVTITGNLTITNNLVITGGTNPLYRLILVSSVIATPRIITVPAANVTASNVDFRDITFTNAIDLSAITGGSGDALGNTGITFTVAQPNYWVGDTGSWSDVNHWASTPGGTGGTGRVPLPQDDALFTAASFTTTGRNVTANCTRMGKNVDFSAIAVGRNPIFSHGVTSLECYGSFILKAGMTAPYIPAMNPQAFNLYGRGTHIFNTANVYTILGTTIATGNYTLGDHFNNDGNGFTIAGAAIFNALDYNITVYVMQFSGTSNITLGAGTINTTVSMLVASGVTFNCGTSLITSRLAIPTYAFIFNGGGKIFNKVNIFAGSGIITFPASATIAELSIGAGRPVNVTAGVVLTLGKISLKGTATAPIVWNSLTAAIHTITYTGTIQPDIKFCTISYLKATNPLITRASTDGGHNTNVIFNSAKFWIGGTGNVTDSSHWAATSNGLGGVAPPDASSDVFFDENSITVDAQIVTMNASLNCLTLDFENLAHTMTLTSSVYEAHIYGSLFLSAGRLTWNFTGTAYTYFNATSSQGITSNGMAPSTNIIFLDSSTGIWTLQDNSNLGAPSGLYVNNGTFNTNNLALTTSGFLRSLGVTKTINLGSSTVNFGNGVYLPSVTGLTLNASTSNVIIPGDWMLCSGQTFNNVSMTKYSSIIVGNVGGFTCNNFTRNSSNYTVSNLPVSVPFNVTDTLTFNGMNASTYRLLVASYTIGTPGIISAKTLVASNVDFRDITLNVNTESVINGTFTADSSDWVKEGTPLATISGGVLTLTGQAGNCGVSQTITIGDTKHYMFSYTVVSSTLNQPLYLGTAQSFGLITLPRTIGLNVVELTAINSTNTLRIISGAGATGTIVLDNISLKEKVVTDLSAITGLSGDCGGNSNMTLSTPQPQFYKHTSGACNWSDISKWRTAGVETLGAELITNIVDRQFTSDSGFWQKTGTATINNASDGLLKLNAISDCIYSQPISAINGNWVKITYTVVTTNGGNLNTIRTINPLVWITLPSTLGTNVVYAKITGVSGNNYIVFSSNDFFGSIDNVSIQEVTNIGRVPLPQDDATFDASSFTGASTLTVDCPRIGRNLDMSGVNQAITMTLTTIIETYGSYILGSNITPSGSYLTTLMGRLIHNLNLYSKTINGLIINAFGGSYTVLSKFYATASGYSIRFYYGTFDFNDCDASLADFRAESTFTKLYFGNGTIELTGTNGFTIVALTANKLYAENSTLKFNPTSGSLPITLNINGFGESFNNIWFSGAHTDYFTIVNGHTINSLLIDAGRKVKFTAGTTQQISKFTATGSPASHIAINSTAGAYTFNKLNAGYVQSDYIDVSNGSVTPANTWYAGKNSSDGGGNTGWLFKNYIKTPASIIITDAH